MSDDTDDQEANEFAMQLLVPDRLLREAVAKLGGVDPCDDANLVKLAKKFGVSLTIMGIRLGQIRGTK